MGHETFPVLAARRHVGHDGVALGWSDLALGETRQGTKDGAAVLWFLLLDHHFASRALRFGSPRASVQEVPQGPNLAAELGDRLALLGPPPRDPMARIQFGDLLRSPQSDQLRPATRPQPGMGQTQRETFVRQHSEAVSPTLPPQRVRKSVFVPSYPRPAARTPLPPIVQDRACRMAAWSLDGTPDCVEQPRELPAMSLVISRAIVLPPSLARCKARDPYGSGVHVGELNDDDTLGLPMPSRRAVGHHLRRHALPPEPRKACAGRDSHFAVGLGTAGLPTPTDTR
jgi:hypothetical protein